MTLHKTHLGVTGTLHKTHLTPTSIFTFNACITAAIVSYLGLAPGLLWLR